MNIEPEVISVYSQQEAIDDGLLVEVFKNRWLQLSGGKMIVVTRAIIENISLAGIQEIWNEYVIWKNGIEPRLKEEDKIFSTKMNDETVWVLEDGQSFTILYPSDY